jgi:glycosyltransferase involved in cell wall biosynthesis
MLREQERYWLDYPEHIKRQIEIIVVDDCTAGGPPAMNNCGIRSSLYRIQNDIPWNWLEARNIGARHAEGKWLLLTDIDHVVPAETLDGVFSKIGDGEIAPGNFYTFDRRDAPDLTPYKHHPDSFLMTRAFFWKVGGYDEYYAGHYGTSGLWRQRCKADASTTTLTRKEGRDPDAIKRITEWKQAMGIMEPGLFMQPYEKVWECWAASHFES